MNQTILFKASGRNTVRPVMVLGSMTAPCISSNSSLYRALSWRQLLRAVFSPAATLGVAVVVFAAMMWHNATVADTLEAQRAVAMDALCALPWGAAWAVRAVITAIRKGGEL